MSFQIDLKDFFNHYFIEETDGVFYAFRVKESLEQVGSFPTSIKAIKFCLKKMGHES